MVRLPQPGSDDGRWGDILNEFLTQSLKPNGEIKDNVVTSAAIANGSITETLLDSAVQVKLNNVAPVISVAGKTGTVTLVKADVGLGNVDNTSDANKPISNAVQTALNAKRGMVTPEQYGAVGNGTTDDTTALTNMFAAAAGKVVYLDPSKQYKHTTVLTISGDNIVVTGGGTLLATAEQTSAVAVTGSRVTFDNVTLKMASTTQRWSVPATHKLWLTGNYFTANNLVINGSAAGGVFVQGAANFTLRHVEVFNTRADAVHITNGAHDGTVIDCYSHDCGDDGFAVVSYDDDVAICSNITNIGSRVKNGAARGFSVVGGTNVRIYDAHVDTVTSAGLYIACEPAYHTFGVDGVVVDGLDIVNANTAAPSPDSGAVLVYNGRSAAFLVQNVKLRNITISDTYAGASRQVGLLSDINGADNIRNILLQGFTITGSGPSAKLVTNNVSSTRYIADSLLSRRRIYAVSSYTALRGIDQVILIGPGGSVTLPTGLDSVDSYTIKNVDTSSKTVYAQGGQTIDGSASVNIASGVKINVVSDGTNWFSF